MLEILYTRGDDELARVFVARLADGSLVEFVESVQPPVPREEKWVLIVSTLKGCPVGCPICDAGGHYRGRLTSGEMLAQIDYLVRRRHPDGRVPVPKFKVQFARMGDPALNDAVIEVLRTLPRRYDAPGLMPCLSTIAPAGKEHFFEELIRVNREHYRGRFQMQFSLHTTDEARRAELIPARTWTFAQMADFGERFFGAGEGGGRKVALNFAPALGYPLEPEALLEHFSPTAFMVKLTPINPTSAAARSGLRGLIDPADRPAAQALADRFRAAGYETVLSIGELRENRIGSNCGMYVARLRGAGARRRAGCPAGWCESPGGL